MSEHPIQPLNPSHAARRVTREMAREGMNARQILRELKFLDLHHHLSLSELKRIVSRDRPRWKFWFPFHRIGRRVLGGVVALGCVVGMTICARTVTIQPSENAAYLETRNIQKMHGRAAKGIILFGMGLAAGTWLLFKPEDGDDEILSDSWSFFFWLR